MTQVPQMGFAGENSETPLTQQTHRSQVLAIADQAVSNERNHTYGPPDQDFQATADQINIIFADKFTEGEGFESHEVAMIMMMVKMSRLRWSPGHIDNWVDLAGYAACGSEAYALNTEEGEE